MLRKVAIATSIATLSLGACVLNDPLVGSGPIELSRVVQRGFERYQDERSPGHFAVSADGSTYSYSYCSEGRCLKSSKNHSIYRCEQRSQGTPCKIYGVHGKIVWRADEEEG